MSFPSSAARASEAGAGQSNVLLLAGAVALLVGALKFWNLGDLPIERKIIETLVWTLSVFVGGVVLGFFLVSSLAGNAGVAPRARPTAHQEVSVEELSVIESELPEMEASELAGLKGEAPEELASALKKIAEGG